MKTEDMYDDFIQGLRLVASISSVQIATFPNFVNVADEVALIYNDIFLMVPQLKEDGLISSRVYDTLVKIDKLFDMMSNDKSLWSIEKLKNDMYWEETRCLAQCVLKELDESYNKPNIEFISWIV